VPVDAFRQRGFGVIESRAETALQELKLKKLDCCVISTGNDRRNIALAIKLLDTVDEKQECKIHVRVDNRDLSVLFQREVLGNNRESNVKIVCFSLDELVSKQLFAEHSILGLQPDIINSDQAWSVVVIGSSSLAVEIIYHLASITHLPEQNHLTIHCVNLASDRFYGQLEKRFPGISNIPHLSLKSVELDHESLSFYKDDVWQNDHLVSVFVATEDEDTNLDIAVNLQDTTYTQQTVANNSFDTLILFAMYTSKGLGEKIDNNKDAFANFYSFGNITSVAIWENLIDEKLDTIAKLIHYEYELRDNQQKLADNSHVRQSDVDTVWTNTASLSDRDSCRAQAMHIDVKLSAFGLEKQKSSQSTADLLLKNKQKLELKIEGLATIEATLENYHSDDFPDKFDTPLDKAARAEHNRWNAFHYLRGWSYSANKNKDAKLHDCLRPLEECDSDDAKITYQNDILSILRIPIYLAHTGYKIVDASVEVEHVT